MQSTNLPSAPANTNMINKILVKLSNFPNFNGDMANWGQFHMLFVSMALVNRLNELLKVCTNHATKIVSDSDYVQKCKDLYNLLDKACKKGNAHAKVY